MAKRNAPKQNKGGDNPDGRKNGKAWKKHDGMARQTASVTGRTVNGYSLKRIQEWAGKLGEHTDVEVHNTFASVEDLKPKVLSKTKLAACDAIITKLV